MFGRFSFLFLSSFLSHLPALRPGGPGDAAHPLSQPGSPWLAPAAAARWPGCRYGHTAAGSPRVSPPCPSSSHGTGSGGHAGGSAQAAPGVGTGLCPALQRRGWPEGDATPLRASSRLGHWGKVGCVERCHSHGQYLASPWVSPEWAPRCHGSHRSWHRAVLVTASAGVKPGTGRFVGSCVGRS